MLTRNNASFWWDLRGNHDCFNVCGWDSPSNHFVNYSATRSPGFAFEYEPGAGAPPFLFLGIDGCPECGLARPYNFFGIIDGGDLAAIKHSLTAHSSRIVSKRHEYAKEIRNVFAFSHYPLSFTMTFPHAADATQTTSASIFSQIGSFMCGHLHKFRGRSLSTMYARRATGILELELGDLKVNGMVRIVVVDGSDVVFADFSLHEHLPAGSVSLTSPLPKYAEIPEEQVHTPLALVLRPRDARYAINMTAKSEQSSNSDLRREVQILVFSAQTAAPQVDLSVVLSLDGGAPFANATYAGRRVWRAELPEALAVGEHELLATVFDHRTGNAARAVSHFVSKSFGRRHDKGVDPDAVLPLNAGLGELIIGQDFVSLSYSMFIAGIFLLQVALLLPKLATTTVYGRNGQLRYARYVSATCHRLRYLDAYSSGCTICAGERQDRSLTGMLLGAVWRTITWFLAVQLADIEFFLRAMLLRLCELARLRQIWYPVQLSIHVLLHAPMLVGRLVGGTESEVVRLHVYGMYVEHTATAAVRFVALGDAWFLAFTQVWTLFVPLLVFISFSCVPPRWMYGGDNPRRLRPLHVRPGVLAIAAAAVCHHLYNFAMIGVFYDWQMVVCSPLGWLQLLLLFTLVQSVAHGKALLTREVPTHAPAARHDECALERVADKPSVPRRQRLQDRVSDES